MARPHARHRTRGDLLTDLPRDEPPPTGLGNGRMAGRDLAGDGPCRARLASAARGDVLERGLRRRPRVVRCVPSRGARGRAIPVSMYPVMLDGRSVVAV